MFKKETRKDLLWDAKQDSSAFRLCALWCQISMYRAAGHDKGSGAFSCLSCTVTIRTWSEGKWLKHSPLINKQHASQNNQHVFRCLRNVTSFFPPVLFLCVRLFVDVYQGSLPLPLSLCHALWKHLTHLPSSCPHAFLLVLTVSLAESPAWRRHIGLVRHWNAAEKLCSMCAWHVSSRCPTDTHFMQMSCLGSAIRQRGREVEGAWGLTPASSPRLWRKWNYWLEFFFMSVSVTVQVIICGQHGYLDCGHVWCAFDSMLCSLCYGYMWHKSAFCFSTPFRNPLLMCLFLSVYIVYRIFTFIWSLDYYMFI